MVGMVLASRLDLASQSSAQTVAVPAVNSAPITGPVTATTFREVAKAVSPAVVTIRAESLQEARESALFGLDPDDLPDFFQRQQPRGQGGQGQRRQQRPQPREELVQGRGTGFIIDKAGLILTNNHVIDGAARIKVGLYGEDGDQGKTAPHSVTSPPHAPRRRTIVEIVKRRSTVSSTPKPASRVVAERMAGSSPPSMAAAALSDPRSKTKIPSRAPTTIIANPIVTKVLPKEKAPSLPNTRKIPVARISIAAGM